MAIKNFIKSGYTKLNLNWKDDSIVSSVIKIIRGIYQGDSLSVILFILALDPLFHLLRSIKRDIYMVRIDSINRPVTFLLTT